MSETIAEKRARPASAWWSALLGIVIAVASLMVRLPQLDVFVTSDELKWVCRSINFYRALASGDLETTRQTGHPGVMTMWLGVPFMAVDLDQQWLESCRVPSISDMIEDQGVEWPQELSTYLFRARRGVVWFTSVLLGLSVILMVRLFGHRVAALTGVLLAIDPFLAAHSRFLHLDAITTVLLFVSVLLLLCARRADRWHWWALSGVAGALAMLNKSPAMFVAPFAGLVLVLDWLVEKRTIKQQLGRLLIWGGGALLTYVCFWPAMWVSPGETLELVINTAFFYASNPHTNSNYFWGAPRPDPGPFFYPVALAFRLTPLSSLGAVLGLPWLWRKSSRRTELWIAAAFVALYAVFMTLGQKKFDRYLLPVHPFVQLIAAVGIWGLIDWLVGLVGARHRQIVNTALALGLALAIGATGSGVLARLPYYLTYYSPVMGGLNKAKDILLVGWGEGLEQAAAYLNGLPDEADKTTSARALPDFAPFYNHPTVHEANYDPAKVSYVVQYLNEVQRRLEPEMMERYYDSAEPLHVVQIDGVDFAWIYKNRTAEPVIALIEAQGRPGDVILVSRPSLFESEYGGDLPVYEIDQEMDDQGLLAQLEAIRSEAARVWWVEYWEKNPNGRTTWVANLLRTHGKASTEATFTDISVSLWELSEAVSFAGSGPLVPTDLVFGSELALQSYQLAPEGGRYGSGAGLNLTWLVTDEVRHYYRLYVNVLDDRGHRWGLGDTWMLDRIERPTVYWQEGEVISEQVAIEIFPGIMPGRYRLVMGLRDRLGDDHPQVTSASGESYGNEVELGELLVAPSPWNAASEIVPEVPLEVEMAEGLRLVGCGQAPANLFPGDELELALYWQAVGSERAAYDVVLELVGADDQTVATSQTTVGSESYPTSAWANGEALWDYYRLPIPTDAAYANATLRVQLVGETGTPDGVALSVGSVEVSGRLSERPQIAFEQLAQLGESVTLLGYQMPSEAPAGGVVELTLYWEANGPAQADYTVFTHLIDAEGSIKAQQDSMPMAGHRPTSGWEAGEYFVDRYAIPVDPDAAPGIYYVAIGMYDAAADFDRVPLYVAGDRQPDDRLLLSRTVMITAPSD